MLKYILFLASFLLVSCEENVRWIDEMEVTPKLTISALLSTGTEDNQQVSVHTTGVAKTSVVTDAAFQLTVNGQQVDSAIYTICYDSIPMYANESLGTSAQEGYYYLNYHFKPGDEVSLRVQSKGQTAEAHTEVPYPIEITGVDTLHLVKYDDSGDAQDYLRLMIHLRQPEEMHGTQYFRLAVNKTSTYYLGQCNSSIHNDTVDYVDKRQVLSTSYEYDSDIALRSIEQKEENDDDYFADLSYNIKNIYGIFRNSVFKNKEYTLTIDVEYDYFYYSYNHYYSNPDPNYRPFRAGYEFIYEIKVYTLPRIEYLYLNSLCALSEYESGLISSNPPVVPSNIEGGTGIFSISAKAAYTLTEGPGQLLSEGDKIE